ncbi:MAG TPA: efflux transporter outer membrane subunit [Burkholderiales bacterium]|nr:efflux transporter outer membrane subunit [Burkholderiales bacterium]
MKRFLILVLLLSGCNVGPDYVRPKVETPAAYKEAGEWKPAQPRDAEARGNWWKMYGDPELNALIAQVDISNQTIAAAAAQVRISAAITDQSRAQEWPVVTGTLSRTESKPSSTTGPIIGNVTSKRIIDSLPLGVSWEADLWGRVRRLVESGEATTQASAADLVNARLSAQATLAQTYFQLRTLDAQKKLLDETVAALEKSLELTRNRYAVGVAAQADVVAAQAQLLAARAQAVDLGAQRAPLEHAIAVLLGKPAPSFSIAFAPLAATPPPVPAIGVPAELLERRPDVAAAERNMAAANAQIGVAKAAFFPTATLGGTYGYQTANPAVWFTKPSLFWSVGPSLALTLFDAGRRSAVTDQAVATYDQAVATYRGTVLQAFADVEDNLAALRILEQEAAIQAEAVKAANLSLDLTLNQYKAGIVTYLQVVVAATAALAAQQSEVVILGRRMAASVLLVKALGGGWNPR